jgi:hypothetical protein
MAMTEKLKSIMEKVEPWQWAAGVVVALLGIWAYMKKKNQPGETTEELVQVPQATGTNVGSNPASYGDFQNLTEATALMLQDQAAKIEEISGKLVTRDTSLDTALQEQNNKIAATQTAIDTQATNFNNSFNQAVSSFNSSVAQTNKVVDETSRSFETQIKQTQNSVLSTVQDVVKKEVSVALPVYTAPKVTEKTDTLGQIIRTVTTGSESKVYNLGNNGAGYEQNATKQNAFEASLKTDAAAKAAELTRVNQVIADRKAQGLDTSLQTAYLNKIK